MMQKKDSVAVQQFQKSAQVETSPMRKAKIFHNIGFVCQNHKLYGDAINAYKESLRNNPADNETRYNLALCKRLDKQDKNRQKEQQKQQEKMSRDNVEQLLNAAMQNEQTTQRRIKDAMRNNRSRKLEKNW